MLTNASKAGVTCGCPVGWSSYSVANSSWNARSKIAWRCWRRKTKRHAPDAAHDALFGGRESLRRLPRGGAHGCGRLLSCLDHRLFPAYAVALPRPSPLPYYLIGVLGLLSTLWGF